MQKTASDKKQNLRKATGKKSTQYFVLLAFRYLVLAYAAWLFFLLAWHYRSTYINCAMQLVISRRGGHGSSFCVSLSHANRCSLLVALLFAARWLQIVSSDSLLLASLSHYIRYFLHIAYMFVVYSSRLVSSALFCSQFTLGSLVYTLCRSHFAAYFWFPAAAARRSLLSPSNSQFAAFHWMLATRLRKTHSRFLLRGDSRKLLADYFTLPIASFLQLSSSHSLLLPRCLLSKTLAVFLHTPQGLVFEKLNPGTLKAASGDL